MVDLLGEACKVEKEEKLEPSSATNMNNMADTDMNKDMMPTHKNKALSTGKDQLIVDPTHSV